MLNGKDHILGLIVHRREPVFQGTSNHGSDQFVHVGVFRSFGHNQITIPEYGNIVADLKNLIHFMRDIDQGDPLFLQHPHHLEKFVYFLHGQ